MALHNAVFALTKKFPIQTKVEVTFANGNTATGILLETLTEYFVLEVGQAKEEVYISGEQVRSIRKV